MSADPSNRQPVDYYLEPYRFDGRLRRLYRDDRELVVLTPKAADTLVALVERAGRVVEKDELLRAVWGEIVVGDETLVIRFWDAIVAGNHPYDDFNAFGARCTTPSCLTPSVPLPAGTDNHTLIHLRGISNTIEINAVDSAPPDPDGTNTVTIVRKLAPNPPGS